MKMQSENVGLAKFTYVLVTPMMLIMTMVTIKIIFKIVLLLAMIINSIMCGHCMYAAKIKKNRVGSKMFSLTVTSSLTSPASKKL